MSSFALFCLDLLRLLRPRHNAAQRESVQNRGRPIVRIPRRRYACGNGQTSCRERLGCPARYRAWPCVRRFSQPGETTWRQFTVEYGDPDLHEAVRPGIGPAHLSLLGHAQADYFYFVRLNFNHLLSSCDRMQRIVSHVISDGVDEYDVNSNTRITYRCWLLPRFLVSSRTSADISLAFMVAPALLRNLLASTSTACFSADAATWRRWARRSPTVATRACITC